MPQIDRHGSGTFCRVELATTDQANAKSFYSALFGWMPADFPAGPDESMTKFRLNGGEAAAAFTMTEEERRRVPVHWHLYIAVDSADATAMRAKELGGKVIEGPFDVQTFGRMAVIQDPTGAFFSVWQAKDHIGTTVTGESGTFCWADLSTPDAVRAKQFYADLFGWNIGPAPNYPPEYLVIQHGSRPVAGIGPVAQRNPQVPAHWMVFFLATDVDGIAAKAKELGGVVHMPPISMGEARMSVLADPQGAVFSIIRPPAGV
jgi:predicted enzyme related to lactoylglutathione lyase